MTTDIINRMKNRFSKTTDLVVDKMSSNATMQINGKTYKGSNITIKNRKVIVDGVEQEGDQLGYNISVVIHGDVGHIENANGNVDAREVVNSISTSNGEVTCANVGGDVSTVNGDIECGNVSGKVSTINGDISRR